MGQRGPTPTPTRILDMRGSWRSKTRDDAEPEATGKPMCPRWLAKDAKKVWQKVVPRLMNLGIIGAIDEHILSRYCQIYVRWREMEEFITKFGVTRAIKDKNNKLIDLKEYPQVERAYKLSDQLMRIERQFGMTPAARSQFAVDNGNKEQGTDAKDHYFQAG